jgi:hypothetical protein
MQHTSATPWSPASDRKIYGFWIAVLWTGEIIVTLLNFTPAWHQAMVRLVDAWR